MPPDQQSSQQSKCFCNSNTQNSNNFHPSQSHQDPGPRHSNQNSMQVSYMTSNYQSNPQAQTDSQIVARNSSYYNDGNDMRSSMPRYLSTQNSINNNNNNEGYMSVYTHQQGSGEPLLIASFRKMKKQKQPGQRRKKQFRRPRNQIQEAPQINLNDVPLCRCSTPENANGSQPDSRLDNRRRRRSSSMVPQGYQNNPSVDTKTVKLCCCQGKTEQITKEIIYMMFKENQKPIKKGKRNNDCDCDECSDERQNSRKTESKRNTCTKEDVQQMILQSENMMLRQCLMHQSMLMAQSNSRRKHRSSNRTQNDNANQTTGSQSGANANQFSQNALTYPYSNENGNFPQHRSIFDGIDRFNFNNRYQGFSQNLNNNNNMYSQRQNDYSNHNGQNLEQVGKCYCTPATDPNDQTMASNNPNEQNTGVCHCQRNSEPKPEPFQQRIQPTVAHASAGNCYCKAVSCKCDDAASDIDREIEFNTGPQTSNKKFQTVTESRSIGCECKNDKRVQKNSRNCCCKTNTNKMAGENEETSEFSTDDDSSSEDVPCHCNDSSQSQSRSRCFNQYECPSPCNVPFTRRPIMGESLYMDESLPPLHPFWGPTCSLPPGGPRPCQSIRDYYTMQCGQNDGCTAAGPVNLTLIINNAV